MSEPDRTVVLVTWPMSLADARILFGRLGTEIERHDKEAASDAERTRP